MLTAVSPVGALAIGETNWDGLVDEDATPPLAASVQPDTQTLVIAPRATGRTPVQITSATDGTWTYRVDGQPQVICGVGYNPWYATLSHDERARLYARDFAAMRRLGINTIEGWFENQFDEVTLDHAAREGIGVLMPFELNQDWDYTDPNVRAWILDRVSAWVERYRDHPAVRMWAPGNENMHRILFAGWVNRDGDPVARARADAFASFLPTLVDRIHALDPHHPVVYRDAEDAYLGRIRAAFAESGDARPWLVYGANVYSARRLQEVTDAWPTQWPGRPLLISEFAPGGYGAGGPTPRLRPRLGDDPHSTRSRARRHGLYVVDQRTRRAR